MPQPFLFSSRQPTSSSTFNSMPRVYTRRVRCSGKESCNEAQEMLLALIFALTPVMWAQNAPAQEPPGPVQAAARPEHRQHMMEMHKQEMEAMKADIEKLKSSLAEMKANILTIREPNELDRAGETTWTCGKRSLRTWIGCRSRWSPSAPV